MHSNPLYFLIPSYLPFTLAASPHNKICNRSYGHQEEPGCHRATNSDMTLGTLGPDNTMTPGGR